MKKTLFALALVTLLSCTSHAATLMNFYQMAVSQNEAVSLALEKIAQSDALVEQGWGMVFPKVHLMGSEFFQDTSGIPASSGIPSSLVSNQQSIYKVNVYQPLFQGFKEWSALDASKSLKQAQTYRLRRAKVGLFQDIALNFYAVVLRERDLKNAQETIKVATKRIDELKTRVNLGKSRVSELKSAQAQLSNVLADAERLKGEIAVYRSNISYVTNSDASAVEFTEEQTPTARLISSDEMNSYVEKRSDIMALKQDYETQHKTTDYYKQSDYPVVSLQGNYYLRRTGGYQTYIPWDITLAVDWPIYQGGADTGLTKQNESLERVAMLQYQQAKRQALAVMRANFFTYNASSAQVNELKNAVDFAKQSYELQENEYRLGLANNLEVLAALNTYTDSRRSLDRAEIQTKLNAWQLLIDREEAP